MLQCEWGVKRLDTSSPPAPFNGEMPEPGKGRVCKTQALVRRPRVGGSNPLLSAKLLERSGLPFEFVFTRLIPVRRLARGTNTRLADCTLSRLPFMEAAVTFIAFFLEDNQCHV